MKKTLSERLRNWDDKWREDAKAEAMEAADAIDEVLDVLADAKLQIVYLHEKFGKTGTGEATLARLESVLAKFE
jgi:formylmethanofuran dehydrogenase subunit B